MGIDPAYGGSSFGIVITQLVDNQVQVLYADEFQRPDFNEMLNVTVDLYSKYHHNHHRLGLAQIHKDMVYCIYKHQTNLLTASTLERDYHLSESLLL
jgi:hypothetical protein